MSNLKNHNFNNFSFFESECLTVIYNGKKNYILSDEWIEYPVGGMIAEFFHLNRHFIKIWILEFFEDIPHADISKTILVACLLHLRKKVQDVTGIVAGLFIIDGLRKYIEYILNPECEKAFDWFTPNESHLDLADYILSDSGYSELGCSTCRQLILTALYWWTIYYLDLQRSFRVIASEDDLQNEQVGRFWSCFDNKLQLQDIEFEIANIDGHFCSLYTINSALSLLLFESAHCIENNVVFSRCENCSAFFIPEGRRDAIYCNYPAPQNPEKKCKDIGAQIARANKEKTDIVTKEYRKVYMRYKMYTSRHPEDIAAQERFEMLKENAKELRQYMRDGGITADEFLKWLSIF